MGNTKLCCYFPKTQMIIDAQNNGGSNAWNATIVDQLPDGPFAGMCDTDPTASVTAQLFEADGITPVAGALVQGTDYSVAYTGTPQCELSITMLTSATVIGPTQHLIITYTTQLDGDTTTDGTSLTNVAGATQWYSGEVRMTLTPTLQTTSMNSKNASKVRPSLDNLLRIWLTC